MTGAGSDSITTATAFEYGSVSDPTPTAGLTVAPDETWARGGRSAWWELEVPATHDPAVPVRFDLMLSPTPGPYDTDTLIEVFAPASSPNATGPRDLNYITSLALFDDSQEGDGSYLTDGDLSLDPGTYFVRCSLYDSSPDTSYVLRIGDLSYGIPVVHGPYKPPVQTARADLNSGRPQYGVITPAPGAAGTLSPNALTGFMPLAFGQRGVGSSWHQYIDDTSTDQTLAQRDPLPEGVARTLFDNTVNGTGVSGGHEQSNDGNQGDQFYPDGQVLLRQNGGDGNAYTFSRTDWARWTFGALGAISATTSHSMAVGTPGLPTNPAAYLDSGWRPSAQGYPTFPGTLTYDAPGVVLSQRLVLAVAMTSGYTEPTDRVVVGILRGADDTGGYTWQPTLDHVRAMAVLPVPAAPEADLTYRALTVPQGFTFSTSGNAETDIDKLVALASPALAPARTTLPAEPGWAPAEGLPNTWAWRFAPNAKTWPDTSTDSRALGVQVYVGIEYQYQPPIWRWTMAGARQTVLAGAVTVTDPPWLRALQRSDGLDAGGPPRAVQHTGLRSGITAN